MLLHPTWRHLNLGLYSGIGTIQYPSNKHGVKQSLFLVFIAFVVYNHHNCSVADSLRSQQNKILNQ
jgi:hypothetical protein